MVQIAMLLTGLALAFKARSWRQAVTITAVVAALTLAVQTPTVANEGGLDTATDVLAYTLIQAASVAVGLAIAWFGVRRRTRSEVTA